MSGYYRDDYRDFLDKPLWQRELEAKERPYHEAQVIVATEKITIRELIRLLGDTVVLGATDEMLDMCIENYHQERNIKICRGDKAVVITRPENRRLPDIHFAGGFHPDGTCIAQDIVNLPEERPGVLYIVDENIPTYYRNLHPACRGDLVVNKTIFASDPKQKMIMIEQLSTGADLEASVMSLIWMQGDPDLCPIELDPYFRISRRR